MLFWKQNRQPNSPKADNLRRGWMRGFQAFLREQQLVVALESVGYFTMNRKMKSTLQGEFDGIPSRRDQPNKWAQRIVAYDCHQQSNKKTTPVKIPGNELIIWSWNQTSNATAPQATSTESRICIEPLSTPTMQIHHDHKFKVGTKYIALLVHKNYGILKLIRS